ncbi:hypothetical protein D3C81_2305870 [compost metagenome]
MFAQGFRFEGSMVQQLHHLFLGVFRIDHGDHWDDEVKKLGFLADDEHFIAQRVDEIDGAFHLR